MNKQDKELLLQDLCARLPYGLICSIYRIDDCGVGWRDEILSGYFYNGVTHEFYFEKTPISIDNIPKIKPYLRPMSSMTEDEEKEFNQIFELELKALEDTTVGHSIESAASSTFMIDFYNKHHFDYRGLISMHLALEAPEGIYVKSK